MNTKSEIKYVLNNTVKIEDTEFLDPFKSEAMNEVYSFHKSYPGYEPTPLWSLENLSSKLGLNSIYVKDESYRFGLNAFKVLGGSYAVAKYISQKINLDGNKITFETLKSKVVNEQVGDITFVTATDGNHGRGMAWAANQLGYKAVVFMPKGSAITRLENIKKEGAMAEILDMNYDDAVRYAKEYADKNNGVLLQDTAWQGYEEIPTWIMQGYTTLIQEAVEQLSERGEKPTHVLLQAGVGSFASSVVGYLQKNVVGEKPISIILEPDKADCIYKSAKIGDGHPHTVTGELNTIMAGLACGEPSTISWPILRDYSKMYVSCEDHVAALGMRILGNPLQNDPSVVSGESGAVGIGFLKMVMGSGEYKGISEALHFDETSKVLIINTEGDTDPENYRKIVWGTL